MKHFDEHKWPALVLFVPCGLFFFSCVWYLWAGALNPDYYWRSSAELAAESPEPLLTKNDRVVLVKNQGTQVDSSRIVYRGCQRGALHMDLYVLELDPHYGYPHRIDESLARKGFRMGEHHFQVLAASDEKISLKRL